VAMDECALARMCPMEESWDKDVWADGWSTCESENELCITLIGKDSGHTPPSLDMDSVCHSTAWSTCDSPGSTCPPASQSGEELTLQDDSKAHKKKTRPCKGKRNRFRKYVDRLKLQMIQGGTDFKLDDVEVPESFSKDKVIQILCKYQQEQHDDLEQTDD